MLSVISTFVFSNRKKNVSKFYILYRIVMPHLDKSHDVISQFLYVSVTSLVVHANVAIVRVFQHVLQVVWRF
jgi:hypothetical protein